MRVAAQSADRADGKLPLIGSPVRRMKNLPKHALEAECMMRNGKVRLCLLNALTFAILTEAQAGGQNCDAIIQHGLRNVSVKAGSEARTATTYFNHCHKDFSDLSDSMLASVEVEIFGSGGEASYSRDRREQRLTEWCKQSASSATSHRSVYEESRQFYDAAVSAWSRCNELKSKDVLVDFISANGQIVQINLRYSGPTRSGIRLVGVDASGFVCETRVPAENGYRLLANSTNDSGVFDSPEIGREAIGVRCQRNIAQRRQMGEESFDYLPAGVISIDTASLPFQFSFVEEWTPDLPRASAKDFDRRVGALEVIPDVPVGTLLAWDPHERDAEGRVVRERQLPAGWQICDGTNGTPNLKGSFLRGGGTSESGAKGGAETHKIPHRSIRTWTNGFDAAKSFNGDPRTVVCSGAGWCTGAAITSEGNVPEYDVPTVPPFYSVVYIMKISAHR